MLHEIFLSLLGFTGDIIIENNETYLVNTSFDLFTTAETQQINRIVPLGWYYSNLSSYVAFYEVKWGVRLGDPDSQFYRTAMSQGIADLLNEYTSDIAYLEQLVLADGPVPLSHVLHHLQKYLLIMPVIHSTWIEVEKKRIWGCQLLDFIKSKRSGMPVVDEVLQKMMTKVRAVFLKQCLAWMLYGELEDPAEEFFIQSRRNSTRYELIYLVLCFGQFFSLIELNKAGISIDFVVFVVLVLTLLFIYFLFFLVDPVML